MARALGLDFGTTNTVLALSQGGSETRSMTFTSSVGETDTMRTALSFMKDRVVGAQALKVEAGQAAIRQFIDNPGDCRFLQSIKTFAASALFQGTLIYARRHAFEDLMEIFLRRLKAYAGDAWPADVSRLIAGRPVQFAGANPDPALALERYNASHAGIRAGHAGGPASTADRYPTLDARIAFIRAVAALPWPHSPATRVASAPPPEP